MSRFLRLFHRSRTAAATLAAAIAGCSDTPTAPMVPDAPPPPAVGRMGVYASLTEGTTTLVVQVSGPGIVKAGGTVPDTLVFNIPMTGTRASGSIIVPAGSARVITARAYNGLVETHRGTVTADVVEGTNPTLSLAMIPLAGSVPVTVSIGTTLIIVRPSVATVAVGDTVRLSAEVRDRDGAIVAGAVARWASLNPTRAAVDTLGLVTVRDTGEVQIVATYGTVGGSAKVTGRSALATAPYQLTWNGTVSRSWTEVNNWTPSGIGAARVPTASDSVVIPAGTPFSPRLECVDGNVRDLVVEAGATITPYCGSAINVYATAKSRGVVERVNLRPGARVAGMFNNIYVYGDSVRLADSVRVNYLEVNATGAQLRLNNKVLTTTGSLYVYNGTIRIAPGDTIYANGDVYFGGGDETDLINGGVVFFRGSNFNGYRYFANGTNRLVFDRTAAGKQTISGFEYPYDATRSRLRRWEIRNRDGVTICSQVFVTDTLSITSTGTPSVMDSCSSYQLRVDGPFIASANTDVSTYLVELYHTTGTSLVSGGWHPGYTDFRALNGTIKPGLGYGHLRIYASNQLLDSTNATGYLWIEGAGVQFSLNGKRMNADRLDVRGNGLLVMTNAADVLNLAGNAEFNSDASVAQGPLLSAGVLRVGGRFYGQGFSATGTHKVVMTGGGATPSERYIHGMNYEYRTDQKFADLEIEGGRYGLCERARVSQRFVVRNLAALQDSLCTGGYLRVDGNAVAEAGSTLRPYLVSLNSATGTDSVLGAYSPVYSDFGAVGAKVKPGLNYQNLRIFASTTLLGNTNVAGQLWVQGSGVELTLGGSRVNVAGSLDIRTSALLRMADPKDTLWVDGYAYFESDVSGAEESRLTAGVLRVHGYFEGYGFSASGTHKVLLTGTTGSRYINSLNYESRPSQGFQDLEIAAGATYSPCARVRVKGTTTLRGTAVLNTDYCGSGYLRTDTDLVTEAASNINLYNVALNNATGTQNVAGVFTPTYTSIHNPLVAGTLKAGLGYQNIDVWVPIVLSDSLNVAGRLYLNGTGVDLKLNGNRVRVAGQLDLNNNATITMTNPADTLILNGADAYWDGGGNHNGKLTAGTVIVNVGYFCATNYYGSGTHRTVFSRAASDPTRVACSSSSDPSPNPYNDVVIAGTGARLESYMYAKGNVTVMTGARLDGSGTLWVEGTLSTQTGSLVTNNPGYPGSGSLAVVLKNATGTSAVLGGYDPNATYFVALSAQIRSGLDYRYVRVDRSTSLVGNVVMGYLDIINDGTILNLAGRTLEVGSTLNLDNTATVQMTNALDTLKVGTTDPAADMFWDGGVKPAGLLTNGAIVFFGDRFYGVNFVPTVGTPHRVVFASSASGAASTIEGTPTFANVEFKGLRAVNVSGRMAVGDTLRISAPMNLLGTDYVHMMNGSRIITVAGSDIIMPNFYFDDPTGSQFIAGGFHPSNWTYFRAASGHPAAIRTGLTYNNVQFEGDYVLSDSTTFAGAVNITSASGRLKLNGKRLRVGSYFVVETSGRMTMDQPSDTLDVGNYFRINSGTGLSVQSAGVTIVRGDYYQMSQDNSGPSGTHKLVFAGVGAGTQDINTGNSGLRNLRSVQVTGSRNVRFTNHAIVSGSFDVLSPVSLTTSFTAALDFVGPFSSVAGSTVSLTGTVEFQDASGTNNILGSYANVGTTRFTGATSLIRAGGSFSYNSLDLEGNPSVVGGAPLVASGTLKVGTGASFNMPTGSSIGSSVDNYGTLQFNGTFTALGMTVRTSGPAVSRALGSLSTDCVDMLGISGNTYIIQTSAQLDNSIASSGGCGFRKKAAATASIAAGTLIGPAIGTVP